MRFNMVTELAHEHPALGWQLFTAHAHELLVSQGAFEPMMEAQFVPQILWNAAPLDQIETWARGKVPAEMAPVLARGMASAKLRVTERDLLVREADKLRKM